MRLPVVTTRLAVTPLATMMLAIAAALSAAAGPATANEVISTENAPAAIGPYSQAIMAGDTLYLAGQIAIDPATGELTRAASRRRPRWSSRTFRPCWRPPG